MCGGLAPTHVCSARIPKGTSVPDHNHPPGCAACDELIARERTARHAAEAANRAKDDFFLTLSHELRGPLNAILSWVYLLRSGKLDEATAARALETIERNAKAEGRLISDMLDVSRMIGSKIHLVLGPVNLATLVAEAVETVRPEIDKSGILVKIDSPHTMNSINADADRLRQVIENLLLNAVKFTPKGGQITVRLGYGAQYATIAVCDTGQGIRSEFLPHVFERFRQSDATATRLGGLGLGLAIVEHLVGLHGGDIRATSKGEGEGATFTVTLPTNLTADGLAAIDAYIHTPMVAHSTEREQ
jgi:signal transduction histidine kinase